VDRRKISIYSVGILLLCVMIILLQQYSNSKKDFIEIYTEPKFDQNQNKVKGQQATQKREAIAAGEVLVRSNMKSIEAYAVGTIIDIAEIEGDKVETLFYFEEISEEVKERITGKSYGESCNIPYEDLRYIHVLHIGFDQKTHIGELIVNAKVAEDIVEIFKELYEKAYPIERMVLVDEYDADDISSMTANNTSAFNYRVVDRSTRLSLHSYGLAIDINPLYNPYVRVIDGETVILPESGSEYADRSSDSPHLIDSTDACYLAFIKRGFTWGGEWVNSKDYQHFQKEFSE